MTVLALGTRRGPLAGVAAVAKLAAALIISISLLLSIDVVSAGVVLALTLVLLPFAGLPLVELVKRISPLVIAAVLACITTILYGRDAGETLWSWGMISVTEGSVSLAFAILLRVLAIAIPSVVLFLTTDPTDLADGLAQTMHLPSRFVLGALAGMRLVGLFIDDWRTLTLARRARGVADRGRLRRFAGEAFALLVLSLRRGTRLATAMEARGFGAPIKRTWARPARFGAREWAMVAVGAAIAGAGTTAAVLAGTWNFVGSL